MDAFEIDQTWGVPPLKWPTNGKGIKELDKDKSAKAPVLAKKLIILHAHSLYLMIRESFGRLAGNARRRSRSCYAASPNDMRDIR